MIRSASDVAVFMGDELRAVLSWLDGAVSVPLKVRNVKQFNGFKSAWHSQMQDL